MSNSLRIPCHNPLHLGVGTGHLTGPRQRADTTDEGRAISIGLRSSLVSKVAAGRTVAQAREINCHQFGRPATRAKGKTEFASKRRFSDP